ncbi:MAG: hypothetical protein ACFB2W_28600 [Leptolyngbyaceae cyanobacterium]
MTNHPKAGTKVAVYAAQMEVPRRFDMQDSLGLICMGLATLLSVYLTAAL